MDNLEQKVIAGRSLHGERGLKCRISEGIDIFTGVAPFTGSVD